ncbi:MAG TPA: ferredoxin--NADP reductase [Polyangiaceae bacterium]|jgi:ferredoxin--NADP+ reductase|nr:ferredoxin--NADP reductase [Polyangiaceae bacterium]
MTLQRGEVIERIVWDDGLFTLRVAAGHIDFEPGQFVRVALPPARSGEPTRVPDGETVQRSYSLASVPGDPLEFFLVRLPEGALTPSLWELAVGDTVLVDDKPHGFLTMEHAPAARDGWLVSTGTGLAPFLSMLRSGRVWDRFERVIVVNGVRKNAHLGYRQELETHAAGGRVVYVPLVSREEPQGALSGRVTQALVDGRLERAAGTTIDPATSHVMLCGNPEMITDMTQLLTERGLRRHRVRNPGHITLEKWW